MVYRMRVRKEARVEFRCTKAFKATLDEVAVHYGVSLSDVIEQACTELVREYLPKPTIKRTEVSKDTKPGNARVLAIGTDNVREIDKTDEVIALVLELTAQGLSTRKVAAELTQLGYKNKKGVDYTFNMVNTIIKRN